MTFQQDANTTYVNGQSVDKDAVKSLWAAVDGVVANTAKSFNTRAAAVAAGQAALPADLGLILVDEGDHFTVRGAAQTDDDPLFPTAPRWGVRDRIPTQAVVDGKADLANSGSFFTSRTAMVSAGQSDLPGVKSLAFHRDGDYLIVRSFSAESDDPLFATAPRWGVILRVPSAALLDDKADNSDVAALSEEVAGKADSAALTAEVAARVAADDALADELTALEETSARVGHDFHDGNVIQPLLVGDQDVTLVGVDGEGLLFQNVGHEFYSADTAGIPEFVMIDANGAVIGGGLGREPLIPPPGFQQQFDAFVDGVSGQFTALTGAVSGKADQSSVDNVSAAIAALEQAQQLGFPLVMSEAEGLSAVDDGQYFAVVGGLNFQTLFRKEGGIAVEISAVPSLEGLPQSPRGLPSSRPWRMFDSVRLARHYDPAYSANPTTAIPGHGALHALFDGLMADHPDYITRELLGRDALDNPIYEYTASPQQRRLEGWDEGEAAPPKIVLVGGLHGNEKGQHLGNYIFARDLCKDWRSVEELEVLRFGCRMVFIPALNPSGIDLNTRKNHNGVDLNRNQLREWGQQGSSDPEASDYYGPSAGSEAESAIAASIGLRHLDASLIIDHHGHGSPADTGGSMMWVATRQASVAGLALGVMSDIEAWTRREYPEFDASPNNYITRLSSNHSGSVSLQWQYNHARGILLETPGVSGFSEGRFGQQKHIQNVLQKMTSAAYRREMDTRRQSLDTGDKAI